MVYTQTPDRVGRVTSVVVVVTFVKPRVSQQDEGGNNEGNEYGVDDGSSNSRVDGRTG